VPEPEQRETKEGNREEKEQERKATTGRQTKEHNGKR
jgi:hypothetical protein